MRSKRLDVSVFGTEYALTLLHLSSDMVRAGMRAYGPKKWANLFNEVAFNPSARKLMAKIGHTIGHPIKEELSLRGFAVSDKRFGIEAFHGGEFAPLSIVEAQNEALQPKEVMRNYAPGDMLGVFWAKRDGAASHRWDDAQKLEGTDLSLVQRDISPLLGRKRVFNLVVDVTWRGKPGRRPNSFASPGFTPLKQVFHKA